MVPVVVLTTDGPTPRISGGNVADHQCDLFIDPDLASFCKNSHSLLMSTTPRSEADHGQFRLTFHSVINYHKSEGADIAKCYKDSINDFI